MLALSLNGALGHAGLLLVLAAATVGALSTGPAIVTGNRRGVRQAPVYAWLIAVGALLAVFAMQRALSTPRLLVAVHPAGRVEHHAGALQRGRDVERARGVDPALGGRARRFHRRRWRGGSETRFDDVLVGWAMVVMFVVGAFFGLLSFGPANPFQAGAAVSAAFDGPGPNPLLQNHVLVLFHPPILYLGYVGFTVPFASRSRR